jgi:hypothetical protein
MAGKGPAPKPAHLRQRTNRKAGATVLDAAASSAIPTLPNPDGRVWHPLTLTAWAHAWQSPMASQWLEVDADALGRLAILWDGFYTSPDAKLLAEIRLQECRFGLSPLDRSRLQWEVNRAEETATGHNAHPRTSQASGDPRRMLMRVK